MIQNEISDLIAREIISIILPEQTAYFSLMVDETMVISKHEQVSICIRYLDENLAIHE